MIRVALAFVALAACGGGAPQPAGPAAEPEPAGADHPVVIAQQIHAALVDMTAAAEAYPADCAAMARALVEVFDRVRPVFEQTQHRAAADPAAAEALAAAFQQHRADAAALADRMSAAVNACHDDQAVVDAMAKMPVLQ